MKKEIKSSVFELRKIDWEAVKKSTLNTTNLDYPILIKGDLRELESYAKKNRLEWVSDRKLLFNGYWVDSDANAYIIT